MNRFKDLGEVPGGFMGLVRTVSDWLKRDAISTQEAEVRFDRPNCRVWVNGLACDMEGSHAFDILRFVFDANEKGWVNDENCREFVVAAELFKASHGITPNLGAQKLATRKFETHQPLADTILKGFRGPQPANWIKEVDSHNVSSALSMLRAFLKRKYSHWVPIDRQWRLPPFHIIEG